MAAHLTQPPDAAKKRMFSKQCLFQLNAPRVQPICAQATAQTARHTSSENYVKKQKKHMFFKKSNRKSQYCD